ncbi:hypothetical protein NX773_07880 [Massilia solisilvae]|uniref:Uncharacterized protein n=1 Tax=Massilia solisilvae TaxID=1811225 RepID=A0ABT2BHT8_9BURK|nr:hypothetical protein [Massilia solisilvae]MCS0608080.1 hypothetical protein [Massilia solisilvae]
MNPAPAAGQLADLINAYKQDQESVYNTWFVGSDERMKAFRSISTFPSTCSTNIAKRCACSGKT